MPWSGPPHRLWFHLAPPSRMLFHCRGGRGLCPVASGVCIRAEEPLRRKMDARRPAGLKERHPRSSSAGVWMSAYPIPGGESWNTVFRFMFARSDDLDLASAAAFAVDGIAAGLGAHAGAEAAFADSFAVGYPVRVMHGSPQKPSLRTAPAAWQVGRVEKCTGLGGGWQEVFLTSC